MDRKALKFPFTVDSAPNWICPTCGIAPLRIRKESFVYEERAFSRDRSHEAWEPEWIEYVYSCILICTNDQCKEVVTSNGVGHVDWVVEEDSPEGPRQVWLDHFRPKFFQPHLILIKVPDDCPESVSKPLKDSFALFFCAPHAALNNVRMAIESLLTELKVPRFAVSPGRRRFINLHERIANLPSKYEHLKDMIFAIKWLGNAGSHDGGEDVSLDDVMDSYELMEHILQEVFAPKLPGLKKLATRVNKRKGPAK